MICGKNTKLYSTSSQSPDTGLAGTAKGFVWDVYHSPSCAAHGQQSRQKETHQEQQLSFCSMEGKVSAFAAATGVEAL